MNRSLDALPVDLDNTTLPSQLMDESGSFSFDPRQAAPFSSLSSPGKQSPGRPKTMKEYEEQLDALSKENFGLKIRIYFMEQKRYDSSVPKDVDELGNAFTDLKVDYELQKKDLAKKEDLLLHSYRALDALKQQLETARAEQEADRRHMREQRTRLDAMQKELKEYQVKFLETSVHLDDTNAMYAMTFGLNNPESKKLETCNDDQVKELESNLANERARILMLEDKIASLNERSAKDQGHSKNMGEKLIRMSKELEAAISENQELEEVKKLEKESLLHNEALETCIGNMKSSIDDKQSKIDSMKAYIKNLEKEFDLVKIKLNEKEEALSDQGRANEQLVLELRKERKQLKQLSSEPVSGRGSDQDRQLGQLRAQLDDLQRENWELRKAHPERDHFAKLLQSCFKQIKKLEAENERLKAAGLAETREEVNSKQSTDSNRVSTSEKDTFIIELLNRIEELTETLNNREIKLEELNNKMDFSSSKIEIEKSKTESDIRALEEKHEKDILVKGLAEKQKEVDALKRELKKKTYNLQGLVNTELWDKNREIEKLNKACERKHLEVATLQKQLREYQVNLVHEKVTGLVSPIALHQSGLFAEDKENLQPVNGCDAVLQVQLLNEDKKVLTQKVADLESRLLNMPERDAESALVRSVRGERDRAVSTCLQLTNRLRELADFLEGLLPALGGRRRKAVQQAVERSRELSRSLSLAAEESSLLECTTWSELQPSLCVPLLPDISTVDFWSGDEEPEPVGREEKPVRSQISKTLDGSAFTFKNKLLDNNTFADEFSVNVADLLPEGTLVDTCSDLNNVEADDSTKPSPKVKSVNIGKITLTSRKKGSVSQQILAGVEEAKLHEKDGVSDYETWSEPDRDVSYARMGLKESPGSASKTLLLKFEETSETAESAQKSPGRRASETQRLQRKVYNLEQVNEALRSELLILHQLAPATTTNRQDKATSVSEMSRQSILSVPTHLLEEIRNQREKLEASLFHNDYIRRQLETAVSSLKKNQGGDDEKASGSKLKDVTKQLEVAENQISLLKSEKDEWNRKIEMMETTIQQTSNELMEKQSALSRLESQAAQRIKDTEEKYSEKCSRLEQKHVEMENKWLYLEKERDQLLEKISENNRHTSKLSSDIEDLVKDNKKNKKLHEELNLKLQQISRQKDDLQRVVSEQEQLLADAERERQELATQLIARDRQVERAEAAGRELEGALRGQLDAATAQCVHFEARLRDAEATNKRRHVEAMSDLQRRLDAARFAHSEAVLQYTRVANDNIRLQQQIRRCCQPDNTDNVLHVKQTNSDFLLDYCTAFKFQHDY